MLIFRKIHFLHEFYWFLCLDLSFETCWVVSLSVACDFHNCYIFANFPSGHFCTICPVHQIRPPPSHLWWWFLTTSVVPQTHNWHFPTPSYQAFNFDQLFDQGTSGPHLNLPQKIVPLLSQNSNKQLLILAFLAYFHSLIVWILLKSILVTQRNQF